MAASVLARRWSDSVTSWRTKSTSGNFARRFNPATQSGPISTSTTRAVWTASLRRSGNTWPGTIVSRS
ncbi:hypothetical protein SAMN05444680_116109 [Variovorax sp. YR216]|nr:hypothetical protein SAMN05444680_116109 [Variovorax sp. YR216]